MIKSSYMNTSGQSSIKVSESKKVLLAEIIFVPHANVAVQTYGIGSPLGQEFEDHFAAQRGG